MNEENMLNAFFYIDLVWGFCNW